MATIKNFLTAERQQRGSSHGGQGPVDLYEIWGRGDFESSVDFIDRMVVPPGSTVGTHRHGANEEEMYVMLAGEATMTLEGETVTVRRGDMILNPPAGSHGLINDSAAPVDLLVIQVGIKG